MDIKDVKKLRVEDTNPARQITPNPDQIAKRSLTRRNVEEGAVKVEAVKSDSAAINKTRQAANDIVNTINLIQDTTGELDRLVKSIDGIVQQASRGDIPEKRLAVLEKEANQILDAIKDRVVQTKTAHGNPLTGDPIRLQVEKEIGQTLDVLLPDHAKDSFGLGKIDFSHREAIIDTKTVVARAQARLDELKSKVDQSKGNVLQTVGEIDVALQNAESSVASVRDLDAALKLAGSAKSHIGDSPRDALGSLGKLGSRALDLLD